MKKSFFIIVSLINAVLVNAQITINSLDANNANVMLSGNGVFFNDLANSTPGYEIPAGNNNQTVYAAAFWLSATSTSSGNLHTACNMYGTTNDLFPGPISNDYNSPLYTANFSSGIWKITQSQISYHINNYNNIGYTADYAITSWPGNGIILEGMAANLAPYVDINHNGIYDPMNGDYPYIQGNQAVYIILNDVAGVHEQTGSQPIGAEVHAMFYQFQTTNEVNNTTFLNVKIYNRSSVSYDDFRFGFFMDPDIGYSNDDYVGSDSARSLAYAYNGSANDPGGNGQPGYGTNPPAFGTKLLNDQAATVMFFNNTGMPPGPSTATDYTDMMSGLLYGGYPIIHDSAETKFVFSGNPYTGAGWTENGDGNIPADRRLLIATQDTNFLPGSAICYDMAFIFNNETGDHLENVNELLNTADFVQNYYDNNIQPCNQIFLGDEINEPISTLVIYPNPSGGIFTIQSEEPVILSVFDVGGRAIQTNVQIDPSGQVNLNLNNGIYIFELRTEIGVVYKRIEIQK